MNIRLFFRLGILVVAVSVILFVHLQTRRAGIPKIVDAVQRQISTLIQTDGTLYSLQIGRRTGGRMVGSGDELNGSFYYDGSYSNESWDITVRWHKSDTNAPIDKIEISSTDQTNRTIWTRKY